MTYNLGPMRIDVRSDARGVVDFRIRYFDRIIAYDTIYASLEYFCEIDDAGGPGILKRSRLEKVDEPIPQDVLREIKDRCGTLPPDAAAFVLSAVDRYLEGQTNPEGR